MSHPKKSVPLPLSRVGLKAPPATVGFKGLFSVRLLLGEDGRKRVIVAEIADALGLQPRGLKQRVQRSFPKGWCVMHPPSAGGDQEVVAIELTYLPALLSGIEVGRVKPEIRPRLEEIQAELYEALAAYVFEGLAVNRAFPAALAPAGGSEQLAGVLAALKDTLAEVAALRGEMRALARPQDTYEEGVKRHVLASIREKNKPNDYAPEGYPCRIDEVLRDVDPAVGRRAVAALLADGVIITPPGWDEDWLWALPTRPPLSKAERRARLQGEHPECFDAKGGVLPPWLGWAYFEGIYLENIDGPIATPEGGADR